MSFIGAVEQGKTYAPGYFLAHEECERKTRQINQNHAQVVTGSDGAKHVPMGAFYPANNSSTVEGIVYEDVDVTTGNMPGSVVLSGTVYLDRLPAAPGSGVQSALEGKGFKFVTTSPGITRPDWTNESHELEEITVTSAAGTASGDTALTITGYTPGSGESYVVKQGATAPTIAYGEVPDYTWTAWDGSSDITKTAAKITVVSVDGNGKAVASGSATITANP